MLTPDWGILPQPLLSQLVHCSGHSGFRDGWHRPLPLRELPGLKKKRQTYITQSETKHRLLGGHGALGAQRGESSSAWRREPGTGEVALGILTALGTHGTSKRPDVKRRHAGQGTMEANALR